LFSSFSHFQSLSVRKRRKYDKKKKKKDEKEDKKDTEEAEDAEDAEDAKDAEDAEDAKDAEDAEDAEEAEDAEDEVEDPKDEMEIEKDSTVKPDPPIPFNGEVDASLMLVDPVSGNTALHCACELSQVEFAIWLLTRAPAFLSMRNLAGQTPLRIACNSRLEGIVGAMLKSGEDLGFNDLADDQLTPLLAACKVDFVAGVKLLVADPRVDVNLVVTSTCESPLSTVCRAGQLEILRLLLARPVINVNLLLPLGTAPLHIACEYGHKEAVRLLLAHPQIEANVPNSLGQTPFQLACSLGFSGIITLFLADERTDVNQPDLLRVTPLFALASADLEGLFSQVLRSGQILDVSTLPEGRAFPEKYQHLIIAHTRPPPPEESGEDGGGSARSTPRKPRRFKLVSSSTSPKKSERGGDWQSDEDEDFQELQQLRDLVPKLQDLVKVKQDVITQLEHRCTQLASLPPPARLAPHNNLPSSALRLISKDEVMRVTRDLSDDRKLGSHELGAVFWGEISHAPCRIIQASPTGRALLVTYRGEVALLSQLRHPLLLPLIGHTNPEDPHSYFLVESHAPQGSLRDRLRKGHPQPLAQWHTRLRLGWQCAVALLAVSGLGQLPVLHVRSRDVYLDLGLQARLSLISLFFSPLLISQNLASELEGGKVLSSPKSTVFSLGVLLSELLRGALHDPEPHLGLQLPDEIISPAWPEESRQGFARLIRQCVDASPAARPTLSQAERGLSDLLALPQAGCMVCLQSATSSPPQCGHQVTCLSCQRYLQDCGFGCPLCNSPVRER